MIISDTHTHLYLKEFDSDRDQVINKAIRINVTRLFLPAIDSSHTQSMLTLKRKFPKNIFLTNLFNYVTFGPWSSLIVMPSFWLCLVLYGCKLRSFCVNVSELIFCGFKFTSFFFIRFNNNL